VASHPSPGTPFPISLCTLRTLLCHSFNRLTFFSTDFPNSLIDDTLQWQELFSSVKISQAAAMLAQRRVSKRGLAFAALISRADEQQLGIHPAAAISTHRALSSAAAPLSA